MRARWLQWGMLASLLCLYMAHEASAAETIIPGLAAELVYNHRRLILLSETPPAAMRAEAKRAGHYLFMRNQHLRREVANEINAGTMAAVSQRYAEFTRAVDANVRLEGDVLAFNPTYQALTRAGFLPAAERADLQRRLAAAIAVRQRFGADLEETVAAPAKQPRPRPLWDAYVKSISADWAPVEFLKRLDEDVFAAAPDGKDYGEAAARAIFLEWNGEELPPKSILLTFDDGPHGTYTPRVLDILKTHGVRAVFYMVGRNLGAVRNGEAVPGPNAELVRRMVAEGHAVGNHSYSHPVMPKLDAEHARREVEDTQILINALVAAPAKPDDGSPRTRTLRFPYGARNERLLAEADARRLRSVLWNIDSQDWADPVPESIALRVLREVEQEGRGIILMHDIHGRTAEALPRIIMELKKRGYVFLRWDGTRLAPEPAPKL